MPTSMYLLRVIPLPDLGGLKDVPRETVGTLSMFPNVVTDPEWSLTPAYSADTTQYFQLVPELSTHAEVQCTVHNSTDTVTIQGQSVVTRWSGPWQFTSQPLAIPDDNTLDIDIVVTDTVKDATGNYSIEVTRDVPVLKGVTVSFERVMNDLRGKRETRVADIQKGVAGLGYEQVAAAWGNDEYGEGRPIYRMPHNEAKFFSSVNELQQAFEAGVLRIRKYYPEVPSQVANAAIIRYVGYLADAPHFANSSDAGVWTRCGADSILKPYKTIRAVSAK